MQGVPVFMIFSWLCQLHSLDIPGMEKNSSVQDLNRHCKFLMLSYAFEQWGMERVEFRADFRNNRSIQAMKDIGCTVEGVIRKNMPT